MGDFGIKVLGTQYDSNNIEPYDYFLNSGYDSLKIDLRKIPSHFGVVNINFQSELPYGADFTYMSTKLHTIYHNYGYIPAYLALATSASALPGLAFDGSLHILPGQIWPTSEYTFYVRIDDKKLEIWVDVYKLTLPPPSVIGASVTIRYSIFAQNLI